MTRFVYASAILPGKVDYVRLAYQKKNENPQQHESDESFRQAIGLEGWKAWIQEIRQRHFFIHCIETSNFDKLFDSLIDQIEQSKHPKANWIHEFYLDVLGKDYRDITAKPHLEPLFDMEIDPFNDGIPTVAEGYMYPLIPNRVAAHREFNHQLMGEFRVRVQEAYRPFGVKRLSHWIQKTPMQDFVVVYRERKQLSHKPSPKEVAATNQAYRWITENFIDHTGITLDELEPVVEPLVSPQVSKGYAHV